MATITVTNFVEAPVERVFQLFTDIEHGSAHVPDIKRIEMLNPGPVRRGTRWRETRETRACPIVRKWRSPRSSAIAPTRSPITRPAVQIATTFWFETAPGGTQVSIEFELESGGLPPGLLARWDG